MSEQSNTRAQVREFATRINDRLNAQKQCGEDIKTIKEEAKAVCDEKELMRVVRFLRKDKKKREEQQNQYDLILGACDSMDFSED